MNKHNDSFAVHVFFIQFQRAWNSACHHCWVKNLQNCNFSGIKESCLVLSMTTIHIFQFIQWDFKGFHKTECGFWAAEERVILQLKWKHENHQNWNLVFTGLFTYSSANWILWLKSFPYMAFCRPTKAHQKTITKKALGYGCIQSYRVQKGGRG